MRTPPLLLGLLLVLILSTLAGCSRKNPEDVKVMIEGDQLVIVNNSGDDIYFYNNDVPGRPWVPVSVPSIRIRGGERRTFDLDTPGVREHGVRVNWWHRGHQNPDSEYFGADRVRTVLFDPVVVTAVLPTPPDPAIEQAAAASLATVCRDRIVLEAWTDRRTRGAEPSATPPDPSEEGIPSGCREIIRDCNAEKKCEIRLAVERRALEDARTASHFASADNLGKARAKASAATPPEAAANTAVNPSTSAATPAAIEGATAPTSGAPLVVNELASICRERTLLDAWIKSPAHNAGHPSTPPDFFAAAVPWSCRDLLRDCEAQKSCPAVLAEQTAQLSELRARARR